MFHEHEGSQGVYFEGGEGVVVGYLGRGFFGTEDAREGEGEAEVRVWEVGC